MSFRGLCRQEGFLPQVEYVTANSLQDFWTRDYAGGIVLLEITRHPGFTVADGYIADRYKVVRPYGRERTLYVTLTMVTRDEKHGPALTAFIDLVERINAERVEDLSSRIEAQDAHASEERRTASLIETLDSLMANEGHVTAI